MGDVTALMMDVITEKSGHTISPMAVSVCITPAAPAPLPIPYPVVGSSTEGITDPPMRTKINGAPIATVGSCIKTCHGNEPGTLKEVLSLNTTGPCFLVMGAPVVLCELGMMGITLSPCISNKAITVGAGANASDAGGTGGAGGGGGGGGGSGGDASGSQGPSGGGGSGDGGSNTGASGPGSSSAPPDYQCTEEGHPIDVASGYVVDRVADVELPGVLPLRWVRRYSSGKRTAVGSLGAGWTHSFEQRIVEGPRATTLYDGDGRAIHFDTLRPGERSVHRRERLVLERDGAEGYRVYGMASRLTRTFAAPSGGSSRLLSVTDAWSNTLALEYEGERLARIVDTAGRVLTLAWRGGRIVRLEVRARGMLEQWVDYAYSGVGDLVSAADSLGQFSEYAYDRHHRMTATTLKNGVCFEYEYEHDTGRCAKTWGPKGLHALELVSDRAARTTQVVSDEPKIYTYDENGLVVREALADQSVIVERAFDADCFLVAETNGAGEGSQYWYDARGNRTKLVDAGGNTVTWEYADDLPTRRVEADGQVTSFAYDAQGGLAAVTFPSGVVYTLARDPSGRVTAIDGPAGLVQGYEYDAQHNVVAEVDATGARTTYAYDAMGRPVVRTDALGRTTRILYDRLGNRSAVRGPGGGTTSFQYDPLGNVIRTTDPLGRVTTMSYAGTGALANVVLPGGQTWTLAYTPSERPTKVTNPRGETYEFAYDDAGRVISEKTFDGRVLRYRYSDAGRVDRIDYPDGSYRLFSYNRLGHVTKDEAPDGVASFQRDRLGRLTGALLEEHGERILTLFERDALGRIVTESQGDRRVRFHYDARDLRTAREMPDGTITRYTYDRGDALRAVEHAGHRLILERDALGRETSRGDEHGGVSIRSAYDEMDRLIEQRATVPSPGSGVPAVLVQRQWRYDAIGRVSRIEDARWGATTYRYDKLGSLLEARRGGQNERFDYDAAGALARALGALDSSEGADARWEIGAGNVLLRTAAAKYTYDKRGRRTVKLALGERDAGEGSATEYTWDCRDHLREVRRPDGTRVSFVYDALGRRVQKRVASAATMERARIVDFVWDGDVIAADIDSEHGTRCFVHDPGSLVPLLQHERGAVLTYVNDHLGMPKELIDASGRVAWAAAHSAWGTVVETQRDPSIAASRGRETSSPFRLLGQYEDEETGLCHTRFRYFDPEVGRWCSPDPLGLGGGKDLFGFDGCPTVDIDPLGLEVCKRDRPPPIAAKDIKGARPHGPDGRPGHPDAHGVSRQDQADIMNDPKTKVYTGVNENGRPVDFYHRDGTTVITEQGDRGRVITAFGTLATKDGRGRPIDRGTGKAANPTPKGSFIPVEYN